MKDIIENADDSELIKELNNRGFKVLLLETPSNIVEDMNVEEMNNLFLSFSAKKQLKIIEFLKMLKNE